MSRSFSFRVYLRALAFVAVCVLLAGAVRMAAPAWASIPPLPGPAPGRYHSKAPLARGKFLVASEKITDVRFARTVILLTEYGWHGALGVIINRPTKVVPSTVLPYVKGLERFDENMHYGGPVETVQVTMLIRSKEAPASSARIFSDIYASTSIDTLVDMLGGREKGVERFRLYAGYAGWGPSQLDREVAQGGWYVTDAVGEEIFDNGGGDLWNRLMDRTLIR